MAQVPEEDLVARIATLESFMRAEQAAAAVGGTSVAALIVAGVTLTGVTGTAGGVDWTYGGPSVDLLVTGGRIEVKVGASFEVYGNKCSLFAGYRVRGPVVTADLLPGAVAVAPSYEASAELQDDGVGMNQLGAFATFDVVTGLAVGWYRVEEAYALSYSGTTGAPYGIATYRRIAVTRY
jgi:hypothetical protein